MTVSCFQLETFSSRGGKSFPYSLQVGKSKVIDKWTGEKHTNLYKVFSYPLQDSCLEKSMDRGAGWAAVHGVAKSRTWVSDFTFTFFHWRPSLEVQWLRRHASNAGAMSSIPSRGTIPSPAAGVRGQEGRQKEKRRGRGKVSKEKQQHVSKGKNKGCWGRESRQLGWGLSGRPPYFHCILYPLNYMLCVYISYFKNLEI